jgi:Na+-driven multidrug efflux pump
VLQSGDGRRADRRDLCAERARARAVPAGDGAALAIATHLNRLVVWSFAFFGVSIVLFGVLRATGTVVAPLIMLVALAVAGPPAVRVHADRSLAGGCDLVGFPVSSIISHADGCAYYHYGDWRRDRMGIATVRSA